MDILWWVSLRTRKSTIDSFSSEMNGLLTSAKISESEGDRMIFGSPDGLRGSSGVFICFRVGVFVKLLREPKSIDDIPAFLRIGVFSVGKARQKRVQRGSGDQPNAPDVAWLPKNLG